MWWALDVHYEVDRARVAGVGFTAFTDDHGEEVVLEVPGAPAAYRPGAFSERELPSLLRFLADRPVAGAIVDGFAWLAVGRPGLGARLHDAIGVPVIGVAKRGFHGSDAVSRPVLRGGATRPLAVSAAGLDLDDAAERVRRMHGPFRLPTLLGRADRLARGDSPRLSG